jgi:hypothetical protein
MPSGYERELPGSTFDSTERGKARRFLLGIPTFFLALPLIALSDRIPIAGSLRQVIPVLVLALVIVSAILQLSRPQGSERALLPRNLRRIARLAGVPEVAAMITVYGCVVVSLTICILSTVAIFLAP